MQESEKQANRQELAAADEVEIIDADEDGVANEDAATASEAEEFANKIIRHAASLNGVKIDREKFLRTELKKRCPKADIERALGSTLAEAGIPAKIIDQIAREAVSFETKKCAAISFASGIPGGAALAATVPADLAQYFVHVMRIEQKLAYVYGWQTFLDDNDEVDDETVMQLVVLMGVMMGVGSAASSISKFAVNVAQASVVKTIQRQALTKTMFYPVMKKVLRVLGVQLTKQTFAKTVGKVVPVVGGAVSGGLTYASLKPGAERLRKYLRALPVSGVSDVPEIEDSSALADAADRAQRALSAAASSAQGTAAVAAKGAKGAAAVAAKGAKGAAAAAAKGAEGAKRVASSAARGIAETGGSLSKGARKVGGAAASKAKSVKETLRSARRS